jgi:hypothetical protein
MPARERSVLRHLVALLTCLAMLHLTLVSSELAPCTSHGAMDMPGATSMSTPIQHAHGGRMTMSAASAHGAEHDAASPADHAVPVHAACCNAAAPCGLLAVVGARSHAGAMPGGRTAAHAEPGTLRLSVARAPEPPPPRA